MKFKQSYILALMLVLAAVYFFQDPQANGNSRLALTRAVVEQGSLQIDSYQDQLSWATIDKAFYNGHYYSDKAPVSSFLAVPVYFILYQLAAFLKITLESNIIKHVLTTVVMGGSFVITGLVMNKIALLISPNPLKAFVASLAVCLGSMLWPYSAVFYGHVPAAMFLIIAFYLLFSNRQVAFSNKRFFWAGLMFGCAFATDYTTALVIVGLIVYACFILYRQGFRAMLQYGLAGGLGALIPLVLLCLYNFSAYGTFFSLGYSHESLMQFQLGHATGFMGISLPNMAALYHITIDPKFGLFWQSPVLVLAIIGYINSVRHNTFRAEALLSLFAIVSIILMNAGFYLWWGGSAFGPRLLIVALPFFIVPLALIPDKYLWLLASLAVVSAGQMLIPLLGKIQIGLDYDPLTDTISVNGPFSGFSILYNYGLPMIYKLHLKDRAPWMLGEAMGLRFRYGLLVLVGAEAFLAGLFYRKVASNHQV